MAVTNPRDVASTAGLLLPATNTELAHRPGEGRRRTLKTSERVALDIVHDIVAQGLRTGARLPLEAAMVEQYGVSRASLREALRLLEVQGLIRLKPGPGGGPVVGAVEASNLARTASLYFHLGGASYHDLIRTQAILEPICAQLAAGHPDRRSVMEPYLTIASTEDEGEYHRLAVQFHETVCLLAANPVLRLLTEAITHMVSDHVLATTDPVELHGAIADEHAAIARAIASGHALKAHQLMAEHFEAQHDYYRRTSPGLLDSLIEWR